MSSKNEPIAIIGSGCRFPGSSSSPSRLWDLLREPTDVLRTIDRFNPKGFYHSDGHHHGSTNVSESYLLTEDHRVFDPQFFNIKPVEADSIDPLQRILLETVYESLEDAGQTIEGLRGSDTAFYAGVMAVDFQDLLLRDIDCVPQYFATGTSRSIISNRVSYFFDWHGPSMTIDTACSSSMIALHQAVQALRNGETKVAVAAGANLILGPEIYVAESKLNMLSPTGRSRMWDADADGYARGEGFASVVLKTLSDAIRDGDPIDCIIRETGTNQDGRTKGLTMPSASAQTTLIRQTYARAGLDLRKKEDRPHFFEAHGTGTKAGDPIEAEAIYNAFYGEDLNYANDDCLLVGGIKTVIGHTEGTAGLAGIIKGSLALQNQTIPPNLLFNSLNPEIEQFSSHLRIPTRAESWPETAHTRRVSVNSFGFGGSNVHAILESYNNERRRSESAAPSEVTFAPFVFSAASEKSLVAQLTQFSEYFKSGPSVNIHDLSWTLRSKRSALTIKTSFASQTIEELCSNIDAKIEELRADPKASIGIRSTRGSPSFLGVYTGQGAQWATMGKELLKTSDSVRTAFERLDASLQALPQPDRPTWRFADQLMADDKTSRLNEAAISQPLCTAVQVVLTDILRSAGIRFSAVVGHSSGEIAAAYAAGFLSSSDAIRIAYYRGVYAKLATGANGQKGAMMAVGTSREDAQELCDLPFFEGRLKLAASNSPASVTLSGDADAIAHAKIVFEDEKKFARLLKVDTAYHSHHMIPCSDPYVASLRACNIKIEHADPDCAWFSSVKNGKRMSANAELADLYWRDNMVNAVLFSNAVEAAAREMDFSLGIEVGPHPALKGPATQTLQEVNSTSLPYTGVLSRGRNDVTALTESLGYIWAHSSEKIIDFEKLHDHLVGGTHSYRLIKDLPRYAWDHSQVYWHESRVSRSFRTRSQLRNELLGIRRDDGTEDEMRWRNFLSIKEVPWLSGHQVQGQMVFPAAGYVSMALEASRLLAAENAIRMIEVRNLNIGRAITFNDESTGVETMFTLKNISTHPGDASTLVADFLVHSALLKDADGMTECATGSLVIELGESEEHLLPPKPSMPSSLIDIDTDRFYDDLGKVGYGYSGPFRALSEIKRRSDFSTGLVGKPATSTGSEPLMVHPALLDPAFQAILAGWYFPGDGRLWTLHLPTNIKSLRVDPSLCFQDAHAKVNYPFNANVHGAVAGEICGDVEIYTRDQKQAFLQMEGLTMEAVASATAAEDRAFFSEPVWGTAHPDGELAVSDERPSNVETDLAYACERVAYYYWHKLNASVTLEERSNMGAHFKHLFNTISHTMAQVEEGKQPFFRKEWKDDTHETISSVIEEFSEHIDIKLMRAVGENLEAVVRGQTTMLEHMVPDNMLDDFYAFGLGFPAYNKYLARIVGQISHRFPHMKILEIGAGTGGATRGALAAMGTAFSSYTYTDISAGFFEKATQVFKEYSDRMIFKVLDAEKDVTIQGFEKGSYDMIIASNVLHATSTLKNTMTNVRSLLKPGGHLVLLEITNNGPMRLSFTMGGLPGWWLGADTDGRLHSPCISPAKWNSVLKQTGFSGVDAITPQANPLPHPFSIITAQAINDKVDFLRRPLLTLRQTTSPSDLVILGGQTLHTSGIADDISRTFESWFTSVQIIDTLEEVLSAEISMGSTILSLVDLDEPIFRDFTSAKLDGMKKILDHSKDILWLTSGAENDEPYANATVGLCRSLGSELPHLRLQTLDINAAEPPSSIQLTEILLRLHVTEAWERDENLGRRLLWTTEPELRFRQGRLLVPRVKQNMVQNDRLNSTRRKISREVNPREVSVKLEASANGYTLREVQEPITYGPVQSDERIPIRVTHSSVLAIQFSASVDMFICFGYKVQNEEPVIALSATNSSLVSVPASYAIPLDHKPKDETLALLSVVGALLARRILELMPKNGVLHVHEPELFLAIALERETLRQGITVKFTTACRNSGVLQATFLHPRAPTREVERALPTDISLYIDASLHSGRDSVGSRIAAIVSSSCQVERLSTFCHANSTSRLGTLGVLPAQISSAILSSLKDSSSLPVPVTALSLSDITTLSIDTVDPTAVVSWDMKSTLSITVDPYDSRALFSKDKTYILVGLTGEIGLSLARWMARSGAGALVLTSRNPKVSDEWIRSIEAFGTKVMIRAVDASSRSALQKLHDEIEATLPKVGGIANGAMVLHDQFFMNMTLEQMHKVLGPKINGSRFLHEIYKDADLDFFVMYSSLASIVGNRGQSNYCAANTYMSSLAAYRKKRGLAGSVMNIGRVVGLGYLERVGQVVEDQLVKYGFMAISEIDLQNMFAEAIMIGRPGSKANPDMITALRPVSDDEEVKVPWYANPRFSHCILEGKKENEKKDGKQAVASAKAQLASATSKAEAGEIMQACFALKIQTILQLPDEGVNWTVPLVELGVDSLVAVEIRAWFLKELETDMPVLKVLAGASISDLCLHALERIPPTLVPGLQPGAEIKKAPSLKKQHTGGTETPAKSLNVHFDSNDSSKPAQAPSSIISKKPSSVFSRSRALEALDSSNDGESGTNDSSLSDDEKPEAQPLKFPKMVRVEKASLPQSRFWFLKHFLEDRTASNVTFFFKMSGQLRVGDLERAVNVMGERHESLRTRFFQNMGEVSDPLQGVMRTSRLKLERKDIISDRQVVQEYEKLKNHNFDLESGDTMKVVLLSLSASSHYILFGYHHIVMDGVSFQVFLADLEKAYNRQPFADGMLQYPDFSARHRSNLEKGGISDDTSFWKKEFLEIPAVLPLLPMASTKSRKPLQNYHYNQAQFRLDKVLSTRIKTRAVEHASTTFHFYLAVLQVMLCKYLQIDDLVIGIADANRNDSDVMQTIGLFLNLLPLRLQYDSSSSFGQIVKQARSKMYSALAHSRTPFDMILDELNVPRSSSHSPLFQAFIDYRQGSQENVSFGECQLEVQQADLGLAAYDISLDITESSAGSVVIVKTQSYLYDPVATQAILDSYITLLEAFTRDPTQAVDNASLFTEEQVSNALAIGRGPELVSDWPDTLIDRLDAMINLYPSENAMEDGIGNTLTYTQLSQRSNAIALALLDAGVVHGSTIAVYQQPSSDWICSLLAVMRIGAVYVPLDTRNPLSRLASICRACHPSVILTDANMMEAVTKLETTNAVIISVSTLPRATNKKVANRAQAESVAAILFTSGSTGTPKGIVLRHSGIRNEMEGYTKTYKLQRPKVLQQSAYSFDFSLDQIFTALSTGGSLQIVPMAQRGDSVAIASIIHQRNITYTKATPSEYSSWIQHGLDSLSKALSWTHAFGGGEPLTHALRKDFRSIALPQLRLFNSYGPAEASISATKIEVPYMEDSDQRIPAGKPLPNYIIYILDQNRQPVPIGISGEIYISGPGVGLGYLDNNHLTEKKFLLDKFADPKQINPEHTSMYRTGDKGQLRADGTLFFDGRIDGDAQVKLRGLRIELGDIENAIIEASKGALVAAVVSIRGDPQYLAAHVVFSQGLSPSERSTEYLQKLSATLPVPQYMRPAIFIPLDKLPLNNHSKVDRLAVATLPLPAEEPRSLAEASLTESEEQLARIWEQVLPGDLTRYRQITAETDFFHVGGNSLLLVRLQSLIREAFDVALPLADLFDNNTLAQMAVRIQSAPIISTIDWEKETAPPRLEPAILSATESTKAPRSSPEIVLLTGATGYLGKYLLPQLINDPHIREIHCVAMRGDASKNLATHLAVTSDKIIVHAGDLTDPKFGLTPAEWNDLSSSVDAIVHCGARRSFWDNYHQLRNINVGATRTLIQLAAQRKVSVHYVSSAGTLQFGRTGCPTTPPTDGSDGYVASKWASERLLQRAAAAHILDRVIIHRLISRSKERDQPNAMEAVVLPPILDRFRACAQELKALPSLHGWEGTFDLISAVETARRIGAAVGSDGRASAKNVGEIDKASQEREYVCEVSIQAETMRKCFEGLRETAEAEGWMQMHPLKWIGRIKQIGFDWIFATHEISLRQGNGGETLTSRR